jgi:GNAT superfamily N-acetyltransferase
MISFSKESFRVVEDSFHLIKAHWDEVEQIARPLAPLWETYREAEKKDALVCFVARKNDDVVGYAVFFFVTDLHSRQTLVAFNDSVFLKKDCRKGGAGKAFLEYCDEELEKTGVQLILWQVKPVPDFSGTLKAIGYKHFNTTYAREVRG